MRSRISCRLISRLWIGVQTDAGIARVATNTAGARRAEDTTGFFPLFSIYSTFGTLNRENTNYTAECVLEVGKEGSKEALRGGRT